MAAAAATNWKYASAASMLTIGAWAVYAALTLLAPAAANQRYHLSELNLELLRLTIIIPIHLIWLLAIRGAVAFKNYATLIRGSAEAPGLSQIADGLLLTVSYLILSALISSAAPFLLHSPLYNPLVIVRDHLPAIIGLFAFARLYMGSHQLRNIANFTTWTTSTTWLLVGYSAFAVGFVLEFASAAGSSSSINRTALTLLPHSLLLVTLIIPYLLAWFLGLLAAINIAKYARQVKGIIYRQALRNLVQGIVAVVVFAMAVQVIGFANRFLAQLSLGMVLIVVYALLVGYGLGFLFVRAGAKKLARIEAVE